MVDLKGLPKRKKGFAFWLAVATDLLLFVLLGCPVFYFLEYYNRYL